MKNNIAGLRKILNLNQTDLGNILNVAQSTISDWERGRSDIDNASLIKMSEKLNVSIDMILTGKEYSLTNDENEMLENYRSLSDDLKKSISDTIKIAARPNKKKPI